MREVGSPRRSGIVPAQGVAPGHVAIRCCQIGLPSRLDRGFTAGSMRGLEGLGRGETGTGQRLALDQGRHTSRFFGSMGGA
jgi:hypothetical protein